MAWRGLAAAMAMLVMGGCSSPAAPPSADPAPAAGAAAAPPEGEQANDAAVRRLFMPELAHAVDDRCRMMPVEVRRDVDARVGRLTTELAQAAGPAATAPLAGEARRRAETNPPRCDGATQRFLEESVATARRLTS